MPELNYWEHYARLDNSRFTGDEFELQMAVSYAMYIYNQQAQGVEVNVYNFSFGDAERDAILLHFRFEHMRAELYYRLTRHVGSTEALGLMLLLVRMQQARTLRTF